VPALALAPSVARSVVSPVNGVVEIACGLEDLVSVLGAVAGRCAGCVPVVALVAEEAGLAGSGHEPPEMDLRGRRLVVRVDERDSTQVDGVSQDLVGGAAGRACCCRAGAEALR